MSNKDIREGIIVPMITPVTMDGNIDLNSAERIARQLVDNGCIPFIMGTTGEASSIPAHHRRSFLKAVVKVIDNKAPVYVGIASNCLEDSVKMANEFAIDGADFAVAHLPFYYPLKPYQMKEYYIQLADLIDLPLILYNISATTNMSIPVELIVELSSHPNITGVKDSERDLTRQQKTIEFCNQNEGFTHFVGWGAQSANLLSFGSNGLVPSTGNIAPGLYKKLYDAAKTGDMKTAERLQDETNVISSIYQKNKTLGESIAGLKVMMNELGLCQKMMLPPLMQLTSDEERNILMNMEAKQVKKKVKVNNEIGIGE
jgi:dihydrodipicolinate synthase/N-acetylneuraminate lyase